MSTTRQDPTPHLIHLLAPNPGPMTLTGTNTWVVHDDRTAVVVDPGPDLTPHLDAVAGAVGHLCDVRMVLTHSHSDHADLVPRLAAATGARLVRPVENDPIRVGDVALTMVPTPGHTADSVSFLLDEPGQVPSLLAGDTVLGRGTTVVAHPDGRLGDYLASLDRLRQEVAQRPGARILPGHGPVVQDAAGVLDEYVHHRHRRLQEVARARQAGARSAADVVAVVYADLDRALWPAAERSVAAQLEYLDGA